jgi:hypothetical protein
LSVDGYHFSIADLRQIEALSHLEKLSLCDINSDNPPLVFHISRLAALRELEFNPPHVESTDDSKAKNSPMIILGGIETIQNLSHLEKITLPLADLGSADIEYLSRLPALRELDLTGCVKIDDRAVPYFQKMKGLRKLTLEGTGITQDGAEQIDDALPDCQVDY